MIIHRKPEYGYTIELDDEEKDNLSRWARTVDSEHGFGGNNYNDDDLLYLFSLMNKVRSIYNGMNSSPYDGKWREGYKPVPYISIKLSENAPFIGTRTEQNAANDRGLNARVHKPDPNGNYLLEFDRNILPRLIDFLATVFDDNEEVVLTPGDNGNELKRQLESEEPISKSEVIVLARQLIDTGCLEMGYSLMAYAGSLDDSVKVSKPIATFLKGEQDSKSGRFIGYVTYDNNREIISLPIAKRIYNTPGFSKYFYKRKELIQEIFEHSLLMTLTHEFCHVANGHWNLRVADPDYTIEKRIAVCAEQNADDTAMRILMSAPLFEGIDGNPMNPTIMYTRNELIHEWSIIAFSAYISLSWRFHEEDRIWNQETVDCYSAAEKVRHPPYQFRAYNTINRAIKLLYGMLDLSGIEEIRTADGYGIDKKLAGETENEIKDLLFSFEAYFDETYRDKRSYEQKINQSWRREMKSLPADVKSVPFLMIECLNKAKEEARAIHETWPELKKRLEQAGTYSMLYDTI